MLGRANGGDPQPAVERAPYPQGEAHYPPRELRWTNNKGWMTQSRVMVARSGGIDSGLVFVHGWRGRATETWEAFPRAIRFTPEAVRADAFLVEYPTTRATVTIAAGHFADFLKDLLSDPAGTCVNPSLPQGATPRQAFRYKRLILVAHSMGAAVVRRAVIDLDSDELTNAQRESIQLLFFAPAHKGSTLPLLVQSGLGLDRLPGAGLVGKALTLYYRSLEDLAENSDFLRGLADGCKTAREERMQHGDPYGHLRAHVYHADGDKVVVQNQFDRDYRIQPVMGTNHRGICKPDDHYRIPVAALQSLLV